MKGLLHSKRFKANLRKWLLMYVGVMGLLTTVITYSKYISSMMASDESRVTKFNVKVNFANCNNAKDNICDLPSNQLPISKDPDNKTIEYRITVDPTDIEVTTKLRLTAKLKGRTSGEKLPDGFSIKNIERVNKPSNSDFKITSSNIDEDKNKTSMTMEETVEIGENKDDRKPRDYIITIEYASEETTSYLKEYSLDISYAAFQVASTPSATPNRN